MIQATAATPRLEAPGIRVAPVPPEGAPADGPVWIDAVAVLPLDAAGESLLAWVASLFVVCVNEATQGVVSANLLKDRMVFPDEIEQEPLGEGLAARVPLHFELATELGRKLPAGRYHLHLSARQLLSNRILLEIG